MEKLRGTVVKRLFAAGSKSEHDAVFLDGEDGASVRLRRAGGNPFADEMLDALVGSKVEVAGTRRGDLFIVSNWTLQDP